MKDLIYPAIGVSSYDHMTATHLELTVTASFAGKHQTTHRCLWKRLKFKIQS